MKNAIARLISLLGQKHGLDASPFDEPFLAMVLRQRSLDAHLPPHSDSTQAYLERLGGSRAEALAFHGALHVGFTEFFRNPLTFAVLEQLVLPDLLGGPPVGSSRSELRIWSAGCATGEEPYSVAILLDELGVARPGNAPHRIFATDRDEERLAAARLAVYGKASVRNVRQRHLERYFTKRGECYAVVPPLKDRLDFSAYDLLEQGTSCPPASIFGDFDLTLCSNLILYYRADLRKRIIDKLLRSLRRGGYLVTGETERSVVAQSGGFREVAPAAAVFRKE